MRLREARIEVGGWGYATPYHDRQDLIQATNCFRQRMQCASVDATGPRGIYSTKRQANIFFGVTTRGHDSERRGISRGDSGANAVFQGAPNEIVGILAAAEAPGTSGTLYGEYNGWTNLVSPSAAVMEVLCRTFQLYAWSSRRTGINPPIGGDALKKACEDPCRSPVPLADVTQVGPYSSPPRYMMRPVRYDAAPAFCPDPYLQYTRSSRYPTMIYHQPAWY